MPDIFISHSERDRDAAQQLASFLEGQGRSVWWDNQRASDERNADAMAMLGSARAVIAIWSKSSLSSPFVLQQAIAARDARKLVHTTRDVPQAQVPLGYDGPLLDVTDVLQIALAVLPYCSSSNS